MRIAAGANAELLKRKRKQKTAAGAAWTGVGAGGEPVGQGGGSAIGGGARGRGGGRSKRGQVGARRGSSRNRKALDPADPGAGAGGAEEDGEAGRADSAGQSSGAPDGAKSGEDASGKEDSGGEEGQDREERWTTPVLTGVERIDWEVSLDNAETAMEMLGREEDWEPNPTASAAGPWYAHPHPLNPSPAHTRAPAHPSIKRYIHLRKARLRVASRRRGQASGRVLAPSCLNGFHREVAACKWWAGGGAGTAAGGSGFTASASGASPPTLSPSTSGKCAAAASFGFPRPRLVMTRLPCSLPCSLCAFAVALCAWRAGIGWRLKRSPTRRRVLRGRRRLQTSAHARAKGVGSAGGQGTGVAVRWWG